MLCGVRPATAAVQRRALKLDIWKLLEERWPFEAELAEVGGINRRFGLSQENGFSDQLRPVFFVGNLQADPEILVVGMKPGLNSSGNTAFENERQALSHDFARYKSSRIQYFDSPALNRRHYWPTAKAAATLLGQPFPEDPGRYLAQHALQVELLPFFQPHAVLGDADFARVRRESKGGRLAHQVLAALIADHPWRAIVVRYAQTLRVFRSLYPVRETSAGHELTIGVRQIPVFRLAGRYISDADVLLLAAGTRAPMLRKRRAAIPPLDGTEISEATDDLRDHIRALGADVVPLPRRTNGSFVFRRRRNFVTLAASRTTLRIDVFTESGWQNGVKVLPGVGIDEAKRLIDSAYTFAG